MYRVLLYFAAVLVHLIDYIYEETMRVSRCVKLLLSSVYLVWRIDPVPLDVLNI